MDGRNEPVSKDESPMSPARGIVRISISIANIAIAIIVLLSVYPFVSGDFKVDLPDASDIKWGFSNGNITLQAPVEIDNGGFYDVTDVRLSIIATNQTDTELINSTNNWGTIPAGIHSSRNVNVQVDFNAMLTDGFDWMIFHPDFFEVSLRLTCKYTFDLIEFRASYKLPLPWEGFIIDWGFGAPAISGNLSQGASIQLPYFIETNSHLSGYTGSYSIVLRNGTGGILAQSGESVALGINHSSALTFDLNYQSAVDLMLNDQTLTAVVTVRFSTGFQVTFTREVDWTAPGSLIP